MMQEKREIKQTVKKPLRTKIITVICIVIAIVDISCVMINYNHYMDVNRDYSDSLAETVANTVILVIDGDNVTGYLESRKRDTSYYSVWNKLIDYKNTSADIVGISVVNFDEQGGHYVFDTELSEQGAFLGDIRPFDSRQEEVKDVLISSGQIEPLVYGGRTDYYIPILSSYNIPVAYIIVGISTESVQATQYAYLLYITILITAITFAFGVFLIIYMNKFIIRPINTMSEAAINYSATLIGGGESPIGKLEIRTDDELERLCESLKHMERDIISSSSQLAIADWNSSHDSMTQMYNKRAYEEQLAKLESEQEVGIVYLDVDNLKRMNDTYGHENGDKVIINAAEMIKKYLNADVTSYRVGGDEFVVLVSSYAKEAFDEMVEMMKADGAGTLSDPNDEFFCRLAIGGVYREENEELQDTIKRAESMMYQDKHTVR